MQNELEIRLAIATILGSLKSIEGDAESQEAAALILTTLHWVLQKPEGASLEALLADIRADRDCLFDRFQSMKATVQ